jgi:hypothetical protein
MATTESLIVELDAKVGKYNKKMEDAELKTGRVGKTADKASVSISGITIAATAAVTAISALIVSSARYAKEVQVASNRSGETVERMQELAFATDTVGISLEKLGDITKDTNEKIGEFLTSGGGGFVDFVEVMNLSGKEARAAAEEFEKMSGADVLQEMVKRMEAAGTSTNRMSFALEGVASDATDLIPLLRDNAKGLKELTSAYSELGLALTQEQLDRIKEVSREFNILSETFTSEGRQLIADHSEELIKAIGTIATFGSITLNVLGVIGAGWGNLIDVAGAAVNDAINEVNTLDGVLKERSESSVKAWRKLFGIETAESNESGKVTTALLKGGKLTRADDKVTQDQKLKNLRNFTKGAAALNQAFFEDNKAINAGLIIADTAAAAISAYKTGGPAAAFAAVAFGLAQLAANASASKGGGEISGGAVPQVQPQQQDFIPETTGLELSEATAAGGDVLRIEFATDTGDNLMNAIATSLNEGQKRGQF